MPSSSTGRTISDVWDGKNGQSQAEQTAGDLKDKYDQWQEIIDLIPQQEPPPEGLVPLWPGSDIYTTPNAPVDPGDCDRWPGSMACNDSTDFPGNPANWAPENEVSTSYSDCSICLTVSPSFGPISFPPFTICRIKPECEEPYEEPPPDPVFEDNSGFHPPSPEPMEWAVMPTERLIWFYLDGATSEQFDTLFNADGTPFDRRREEYTLSSNVGLNNYTFVRFRSNNGLTVLNPPFYGYLYGYNDGSTYVVRVPAFWRLKTFIKTLENGNWDQAITFFELPDGSTRSVYWNPVDQLQGGATLTNGNEPNAIISRRKFRTFITERIDDYNVRYIQVLRTTYFRLRPSELPNQPTPTPTPTPTPIPSPQPMPRCCDLSPILKKLAAIEKAIGKFPAEVDVGNVDFAGFRITTKKHKINSISEGLKDFYRVFRPDEFGKRVSVGPIALGDKCFIPKRWVVPGGEGNVPIENYQELILHLFRFLDRSVGFLPFHIKVKDANPAQEGDQGVSLTCNSIADALKEMGQYLIDTEGDTDAVLNAVIRCLYTAGSAQQLSYQTLEAVEALHEIIGGNTDYKKKDMMMAFSPDGNMALSRIQGILDNNSEKALEKILPRILDAKKVPVRVLNASDDAKSLIERLIGIERHVANSAAAVTRPVNSKNDLQKLVQASYLAERLGAYIISKAVSQQGGIGELKTFLEDAEKAFSAITPDDQARPAPPQETAGRPFGTTKGAKATRRKTRRKK